MSTSRNEPFVAMPTTRIWREVPQADNAYAVQSSFCHGYEVAELAEKRSFVDVLFLLFRGDLPTQQQATLLEKLMIGLINPGPRHPATRAAMVAGVSKTDVTHLLPIGLTMLSGEFNGAPEVDVAMRFLKTNNQRKFADIDLTEFTFEHPAEQLFAPGFGTHYSAIDKPTNKLATLLCQYAESGSALQWGQQLARQLAADNMGWRAAGLVGATLFDLGFSRRAAVGIFQLLCAPGILAHGVEFTAKPITAMPFLPDDQYHIDQVEPTS